MGLFYDPPQPASAADYTRFRDAHLAANLSPNDANLAAAVAMGLIGARRGPPKGWSRVRRGSAIRTSPRWRKRTGQPPPGVAARAVIDSTPLPKFAECLPREYALLTVAARLRYSVSRHSGAASMRVIADGTSTIAQALSDCFAINAGTTYNLRFWYVASPPVTISFIGYRPPSTRPLLAQVTRFHPRARRPAHRPSTEDGTPSPARRPHRQKRCPPEFSSTSCVCSRRARRPLTPEPLIDRDGTTNWFGPVRVT